MATYLDNFTDTNGTTLSDHTADSGQSYAVNASHTIEANRAVGNNAAKTYTALNSFTSSAVYKVTANIYVKTNFGQVGFMVSTSNQDNGYLVRLTSTGVISLRRRFFAGEFEMGAWTIPSFPTADTALSEIEVELDNNDFIVRYNGVDRITATDALLGKSAGIFLYSSNLGTSTAGMHIDSLEYTELDLPIAATSSHQSEDSTHFSVATVFNTYEAGIHTLSILATAPDTSTDTDTGQLTVGDVIVSGNHQSEVSTGSGDAGPSTDLTGNHQAEPATGTGAGSAHIIMTLSGVTLSPEPGWSAVDVTAIPDFVTTESYAEEAITDLSFTAVAGDQLAFTDSVNMTVDSLTVPIIDPAATVSGSYKFWDLSGTSWTATSGYTWSDQKFLEPIAGSYTYTGSSANLPTDTTGSGTLTADTGAYSYAGTDAGVLAGLILPAATGAYTYTGTAAGLLTPGFGIRPDSGSYTYTGTDATFFELRRFDADSGSYAYNGTNANLVFATKQTAGDGIAVTSSFGQGIVIKGDL